MYTATHRYAILKQQKFFLWSRHVGRITTGEGSGKVTVRKGATETEQDMMRIRTGSDTAAKRVDGQRWVEGELS